MQMPPTDCIYTYNIMPSEYGLRLRKGYRQWAVGLGGEVRTVIPFEGQARNASADRLWGVTEDGIFNVTQFNTRNPVAEVSFATAQTDMQGYGSWTEFTNDATARYLQYADNEAGLHQYSEALDTWSVPTLVGPVVTNVAFVTTWKNRLWFVEESAGDAWYLPADANSGTCTKFTFGSKFKHGGDLLGLYTWTVDGGDGVDDLLIAVGRGGDVLVYKGVDPDLPPTDPNAMSLVGSYFIGALTNSRNFAVAYGGELYILSTYGLTSIRDLLQGVTVDDLSRSPSAKISRFLRDQVNEGIAGVNWAMKVHPADGFLQIIAPYSKVSSAVQYSQNLLTRSWGAWEGVPVNCAETWNAEYYIGDKEGVVWIYDGAYDGTLLVGVEEWTDVVQTLGTGWTHPGVNTFTCDGTQVAVSYTSIVSSLPAESDKYYRVTYEVSNYVSGNHYVGYGSLTSTSVPSTGDGVFNGVITPTSTLQLGYVFGDADFVGTISNVTIFKLAENGAAVNFRTLTSFQAPENHATYKRVGIIRTIGILAGTAAINVDAVYDYKIAARIPPPNVLPDTGVNVWDQASFDSDTWDYDIQGVSFPTGALGIGRAFAVAMSGNSSTRLNVVGWDLTFTRGGLL
jgi:hypothetical protein